MCDPHITLRFIRATTGYNSLPTFLSAMTMYADNTIQTIDRFVTHISTVPANLGQTVGLALREKVAAPVANSAKPPVVLFVHGGFSPSNVAYDLDYRNDYSFMRVLARAGELAELGLVIEEFGAGAVLVREIPALLVVAVIVSLIIKTFVVQFFFIPSGSMENTLQINDRVAVIRFHLSPAKFIAEM